LLLVSALPACYVMNPHPVNVAATTAGDVCVGTVNRVFDQAGFVRVDGIAGGMVMFTPLVSINTRSFGSGLRWGVGVRYKGDPFAGGGCDLELEPMSYDEECPREHVGCRISPQPGEEFAAATEEIGRRMRLAFARAEASED